MTKLLKIWNVIKYWRNLKEFKKNYPYCYALFKTDAECYRRCLKIVATKKGK